MRPINVSLDSVTWELAKAKPNFSQWVRDQLRSEDNKRKESQQRRKNNQKECILQCGRPRFSKDLYCLHHIEQGHTQDAIE
jgi:hypothetical protein